MTKHATFHLIVLGRRLAALCCLGLLLGGCAHLSPRDFTFVQMCDPQLGFTNYEQNLKDFEQAVRQVNELKPDFVVICGDLVNDPNRRTFADFNRVRRQLAMPSYCAPGNHDVGNAPTRKSLALFRKFINQDYFEFEHQGCRFLVLNTQLWKSPLAGETDEQDAWLAHSLARARKKGQPVFVVLHYPPFIKTADEPDAYFNLPLDKRREILSAFDTHGVKAVLAGHTHTTLTRTFGRMEIVNSESTSRNFDDRPLGFRLWHVSRDGSFRHEFVPLKHEPTP